VKYHCYCHFPGLALLKPPEKVSAWVLKEEMMVGYSKYSASWKTVLEPITGSVVIREAHVCRIKQGRKTHALWGIS